MWFRFWGFSWFIFGSIVMLNICFWVFLELFWGCMLFKFCGVNWIFDCWGSKLEFIWEFKFVLGFGNGFLVFCSKFFIFWFMMFCFIGGLGFYRLLFCIGIFVCVFVIFVFEKECKKFILLFFWFLNWELLVWNCIGGFWLSIFLFCGFLGGVINVVWFFGSWLKVFVELKDVELFIIWGWLFWFVILLEKLGNEFVGCGRVGVIIFCLILILGIFLSWARFVFRRIVFIFMVWVVVFLVEFCIILKIKLVIVLLEKLGRVFFKIGKNCEIIVLFWFGNCEIGVGILKLLLFVDVILVCGICGIFLIFLFSDVFILLEFLLVGRFWVCWDMFIIIVFEGLMLFKWFRVGVFCW